MNQKIATILLFSLLLICSFSFAETIQLKSGKSLEGKITEKTDDFIKFDSGINIPITYFWDEIESIDGEAVSVEKEPVTIKEEVIQEEFESEKSLFPEVQTPQNITESSLTKEAVIEDIRNKTSNIKDISFNLEEERLKENQERSVAIRNIQIKCPDKRREISKESGGESNSEYVATSIENGNVHWRIMNPKAVYKTAWEGITHFIPSPVPKFYSARGADMIGLPGYDLPIHGVEYKGQENLEGEICYILQVKNMKYWVTVKDGIIRQYISSTIDLNKEQVTFINKFKDFHINQNLADSLFEYEPEQGAMVEEETVVTGGENIEKSWVVPYKKPELSEEEKKQTDQKIKEVLDAYMKVNDFSCEYNYTEIPYGVKVGDIKDPESLKVPRKTSKGVFKFKKPFKIYYAYVFTYYPSERVQNNFVITDGISRWKYDDLKNKEGKKYVFIEEISEIRARYDKLVNAIKKQQEIAERFRDEDYVEIPSYQQVLPIPELETFESRVPYFVIEPFKDIDRELIVFSKEEDINGVRTYCFLVKETKKNRKQFYWVGVNDGIPRKIHEYSWNGEAVEAEFELKDVKINNGLSDEEFVFQNDGTYTLQDMKDVMNKMGMSMDIVSIIDYPPEETFKQYFNNPLEDVSDLKGSGSAFRGSDLYISFKSKEKVSLKKEENIELKPVDPKEISEFFQKLFPEDAEYLKDFSNLECLTAKYEKQYVIKERSLLHNKKENIYFFRASDFAD